MYYVDCTLFMFGSEKLHDDSYVLHLILEILVLKVNPENPEIMKFITCIFLGMRTDVFISS